MQIEISRKIGDAVYKFTIDEKDELQALEMAGFVASMPKKCKLCGSDDIHLTNNKAKGFTFIKMICNKCNGRSQLGQYKEGGFFWKGWEKYQPPQKQEDLKEEDIPAVEEEINTEELGL